MRTVDWAGDHLVIIEQTRLPGSLEVVALRTVDEVIDALARLAVRGAPAIGVTGALAVALAGLEAAGAPTSAGGTRPGFDPVAGWSTEARAEVLRDAARVRAARPTAVNLAWGVDRVLARIDGGPEALVAEALRVRDDDVAATRALAERGADLVAEIVGGPAAVLTHCNAGALACVEWGTALGVVRSLHARGGLRTVYADETRPLLQGARLTAWELAEMGAEHVLVVDGAGPSVIARGLVDVVVVGADRIAANGDVANKIGTYPLALAAARAGVPFLVAAPRSTIDGATADGAAIEIEDRAPAEVLGLAGQPIAPAGTRAWNPAFDVTPADLVTAIVSEDSVWRPGR